MKNCTIGARTESAMKRSESSLLPLVPILLVLLLGPGLEARAQGAPTPLQARVPLAKQSEIVRPVYPHRLVVKFRDDLKARSDAGLFRF